MTVVLAALLAAGVAALARGAGALTRTGAVAAAAVGTGILVGAGWPGAAALATFFVGGTVVSKLERTGPAARSAAQVLANGGPAAAAALIAALLGSPELAVWVAVCSLAAAAADTWARRRSGTTGATCSSLTNTDVPRVPILVCTARSNSRRNSARELVGSP